MGGGGGGGAAHATFGILGCISPETLQVIQEQLRFERTTPVQQAVIPLFCGNKDVAVDACTGSGKTLAFVVPIIEKLRRLEEPLKKHQVQVLDLSSSARCVRSRGTARPPPSSAPRPPSRCDEGTRQLVMQVRVCACAACMPVCVHAGGRHRRVPDAGAGAANRVRGAGLCGQRAGAHVAAAGGRQVRRGTHTGAEQSAQRTGWGRASTMTQLSAVLLKGHCAARAATVCQVSTRNALYASVAH